MHDAGYLWRTIARRTAFLVAGAVAIHTLSPLIMDVYATAPRLQSIAPVWFAAMLGLEAGSFAAAWGLARLAVPGLTWGVASMSQLASNSASRVLPGGGVVAGAIYYRMLTRAGTEPGRAAAALAVNSLISTMVLLALPATAVVIGAASVPVPTGLLPVAIGGVVVFVALIGFGALFALFDAPLRWTAQAIGFAGSRLAMWRHRTFMVSSDTVLARRDEVLDALGSRWLRAVLLAAVNWLFDYAVLLVALHAVGAEPHLSLVLLAYSASALLAMIPITPGGLGFVEAGLTAALTAAQVPVTAALLATLAYRLFAFWLPIPIGGAAYLSFRRRYPIAPKAAGPAIG